MSLATALAREGMRPASFLPSIKCSDCAEEIEITEMANHVCGAANPVPSVSKGHGANMSNPFMLRQINTTEAPTTTLPSQSPADTNSTFRMRASSRSSNPKQPRISLPKINAEAANRPYLAPKNTNLDSPLSPAISSKSSNIGKTTFARSMTSPAPRLFDPRPPSPELTANLDCAFPPFPGPASSGRRPSTPSNGRKTPTGSDRAPSRSTSRLDRVLTVSPEPFNMEPKSPRPNGGETVLQKMQTLQAGPFNTSRRGSEDPKRGSPPALSRQTSNTSEQRLPNTGMGQTSTASPPRRMKTPPPYTNKLIEELLSPDFLGSFSDEPESLAVQDVEVQETHHSPRNNTFSPRKNSTEGRLDGFPSRTLSKLRSEPGLRASPAISGPSLKSSPQFPQRKDSISGTRIDFRIQDAPPVPKAVQEHRQEGVHSPSNSGSSMASMTNSTSNSNTSSTSPIGSVASSLDTFSPLSFDAPRYLVEEKMGVPALNVKNSMDPGLRAEQPLQRSKSKKFTRPSAAQEIPKQPEIGPFTPLESPMDPMLQNMQKRLVPQAPQPERPPLDRTQTAPGPIPRTDLRSPGIPSPTDDRENRNEGSQVQRPSARRATNAKPPCRGCGQLIEGKSVKAADGRLTGRWHRACFVCKTCREPFTTADFYVINNEPYCEHHYHEKNGSLCNGCHRGIEGQYLETSSSTRYGSVDKKFHPRCFTCSTCRVVLSQDYFEITGRVFCERHALAAMRAQARQGPGLYPPDRKGLMAERRTTRLINPMMA